MIDHKAILEKTVRAEAEIAGFLVDLVSIPSPSAQEGPAVERSADEMRRLGFDEVRVDRLGNVIGRVGDGPRLVAFDAHVDTVRPGDRSQWSFDPHRGHIREVRVWGRGAADQKGGLAAMVYAGRVVRELGLHRGLTLLFVGSVQE